MDKRDTEREERLSRAVAGARFGTPCYAYAACDSTMDLAQELARGGAPEGTLVWAARQHRGRGRLGRKWESPEGGAYFSLILRPTRPSAEAPQLSLVAGLAVAEAIHEQLATLAAGGELSVSGTSDFRAATVSRRQAGRARKSVERSRASVGRGKRCRESDCEPGPAAMSVVSIRWPNDVLIGGKKVAGILAEASVQRTAVSVQNCVVIGIGVNVSTDPRELPETATSLKAVLSCTLNAARCTLEPLALVAALCSKFDGWYDVWTGNGFAPIREALRPWIGGFGQPVRISAGSEEFEGTASDLDESGRLAVRLDSGLVRAFDAGEVTLLR